MKASPVTLGRGAGGGRGGKKALHPRHQLRVQSLAPRLGAGERGRGGGGLAGVHPELSSSSETTAGGAWEHQNSAEPEHVVHFSQRKQLRAELPLRFMQA